MKDNMALSRSTIIKAFEGALLKHHPELTVEYGMPNEQHSQAIRAIQDNYERFRQAAIDELEEWQLTQRYFGHIFLARLDQKEAILASPIVQSLFAPAGPRQLEERLARTHHITNFEVIMSEASIPSSPDAGEETDEIFLDVWSEVLAADILIHKLCFEHLEKVVREQGQPCADFLGRHQHREYAIEVGRIRRRDFKGSTLPGWDEDCRKPENLRDIEKAVRRKLWRKNRQLREFCASEACAFDRTMAVVKTSQWEYQDCSQVIVEVARKLFGRICYTNINELLLIHDVERFDLVPNASAV
jgi:hypothetical protein